MPRTEGGLWRQGSVADLEASFLDAGNGLDLALVLACRLLLSKYILDHQHQDFNGLSLRDSILPSYTDVR